jgi:hypothetical protein
VGKPAHTSPRAPGGSAREEVGWPHGGRELEAWRRGLSVPRRPPCFEQPSGEPGAGAGARRRAAPHFADAQEEQQLWEELRGQGASLNWALNEALQIHGGPAWRVFQVRRRSLTCRFLPCSIIFAFVFAARRSLVFVCWRQELELRARDRYGTFDQMITELRQLQEQRDTSTPSSRP